MNAYVKPPLQAVSRNAGIDALRASLILVVVVFHAAITYGAMGLWFYKEIEPSSAASSFILTLFVTYNQAFFMGLFFLIAGSLTPGAIAHHGSQEFLRERLLRLGVPLLVFILVLGPITAALAETVHGYPIFAVLGWIASHAVIIPGPMWFVEALLIFSAAYVALRAAVGPARLERARPFPSNAVLAVSALGTGAAAFLLRLRWPPGDRFSWAPVRLFRELRRPVRRRLPRGQGALARKRAGEAALDLAMDLAGRRRGVSSRDPRWPLEPRLLCLLGALFAWGVILSLLVFFQRRFVALGPVWQSWRDAPISSTSSIRRSWSSCRWRCAASQRRPLSNSPSRGRGPAPFASSPPERCWRSPSSGASSSALFFSPTSRTAPIRRKSTSCRSPTPNSRRS